MRSVVVSVCLGVFVFAFGDFGAGAAPDRSRFVGNWVLNSEESDNPIGLNGRGSDERSGRGGPGGAGVGGRRGGRMGGGGFGGGGFGGGGGRMGGGRNPDQIERMREVMNAMRQAPRRLVIVDKDNALVITDEKGDIQRLYPDGSKHKQIFGTVQVDRVTKWKGDDLVSVVDAGSGVKLQQTFRLLPDRKQLSMTAALDGGRGGSGGQRRALTFVYDLSEPQ